MTRPVLSEYLDSVYFIMTTLTTVGYGAALRGAGRGPRAREGSPRDSGAGSFGPRLPNRPGSTSLEADALPVCARSAPAARRTRG